MSNDTNAGDAASLPHGRSSPAVAPPRPNIVHIMLWTLCSAISWAWVRASDGFRDLSGDGLPDGFASVLLISNIFRGAVTGAVLTGMLVLVYARIRHGVPILRHPGHWLLLATTATVLLVHLQAHIAFLLVHRWGVLTSRGFPLLATGIGGLLPAILYLLAFRQSPSRRWKILFSVLLGAIVLQSLAYVSRWLDPSGFGPPFLVYAAFTVNAAQHTLIPINLGGFVALASILDLTAGVRRDWLHWTGVATYVAMGAGASIIWILGSLWMRA